MQFNCFDLIWCEGYSTVFGNCFDFNDKNTSIPKFSSLVHSILNNGTIIWLPYNIRLKTKLLVLWYTYKFFVLNNYKCYFTNLKMILKIKLNSKDYFAQQINLSYKLIN